VTLFLVCHDLSDALRQVEREIEQKAHRVLNHTAKRVMANTSQCCRMAIEQLKALPLREDGDKSAPALDHVIGLLNMTLSESVTGYHMCRNAILQTSIESGDHTPMFEHFTLPQLFDDLGFTHHKRLDIQDGTVGAELRGDLQLLSCILFNAVHNALMHGGRHAPHVGIETQLQEIPGEDGSFSLDGTMQRLPVQLHLTVRNAAGANHDALRATGTDDLLAAAPTIASTLREQGAGAEGSTFLGLTEIYGATRMIVPRAEVHLWVRPDEVVFDLRMPLRIVIRLPQSEATVFVAPSSSVDEIPPELPPPVLPPGLIFVCCDDDDLPRIFAESVLLPKAQADMVASRIVGETYEDVTRVPDMVCELAERYGQDRVIGLFDQNLTSYHEGTIYGTGLCRELRQRGFGGCLAIQSANDEAAAEREYIAAGANGCLGKVLRGGPDELLSRIAALYWSAQAHAGKVLPFV